MRRLQLGDEPVRVLAVGAHPDDIEIGCGGTLLRLAEEGRLASLTWHVATGDAVRAAETAAAAREIAGHVPLTIDQRGLADGRLPVALADLKDAMEDLKPTSPDVIMCPRRDDAHQDHRAVAEVVWQTFRDHLVLEYEIPKYDGDLVTPQVYVELPAAIVARKVELLERCFPSQRDRTWFSEEVFRGLLRVRGLECAAPSGYAEGFIARKLVV